LIEDSLYKIERKKVNTFIWTKKENRVIDI
jgi:hypothetical protein